MLEERYWNENFALHATGKYQIDKLTRSIQSLLATWISLQSSFSEISMSSIIGRNNHFDPAGVLYVCTGPYHDMLNNSLNSLVQTNPNLKYHILCDRPLNVDYTWVPSLTGKASRILKTQLPKFTPFGLTLFVDSDTVFGESLDLNELLAGADIAMGYDADAKLGRGARVFLRYPDFTSEMEVEETLGLCGEAFPFFNSGVIVWRQTEKVRAFFEEWHNEWLKYKLADQLALARAICKTQIKISVLDKRYNFPVLSENFERDKAIYHLIYKEKLAKQVGLWNPDFPDLLDGEFVDCTKNGARSEDQYLFISQRVHGGTGESVLIICPNGDEKLWDYVTGGECFFVSDGGIEIPECSNFLEYAFESRVGEWKEAIPVPEELNRPFDHVIVNGPKGFNRDCPGRQIPIEWAAKLARKSVYVFDYDREWEQELCEHYLGSPNMIIRGQGGSGAALAVFEVGLG